MKALRSVIGLGIGFLMVSGSPARAQYDMGDGLKKGAGDVVKQQAEQAGLLAPGTATAAAGTATAAAGTPTAAATGAASTPGATPGSTAGAANAPAAEPKGVPGASDVPAGAPGSAGTAQEHLP
jgi:hypothetical protein